MLIAREKEQARLTSLINSNKAELIACYGRRRIGKTFLIRSMFSQKPGVIYFNLTGLLKGSDNDHLLIFRQEFVSVFNKNLDFESFNDWLTAFEELHKQIILNSNLKIVLFFDELPWLAKKHSKFLSALDYYWNTKWQYIAYVKVVICGSSSSWMVKHVINSKGGLHNRISASINLMPLLLPEVKQFLEAKNFMWSKQTIIECYMIFGGIPYYLSLLDPHKSLHQNIARLCFGAGELANEYDNLYNALFLHADEYKKIIAIAASSHCGISRSDLKIKLPAVTMATLYGRLKELEISGFIEMQPRVDQKKKGAYVKVCDEFSLFALHWLTGSFKLADDQNLWHGLSNSQSYKIWCGYAFENLCFKHITTIKKLLGFGSVISSSSSYHADDLQIDLLFDRNDRIVQLVEVKYRSDFFVIDEKFVSELKTKSSLFLHRYKNRRKSNSSLLYALITNQPAINKTTENILSDSNIINAEMFL